MPRPLGRQPGRCGGPRSRPRAGAPDGSHRRGDGAAGAAGEEIRRGRIATVRTHVLRHRLERQFQSAFSTFTDRWACLVEIECDDGTVGWGECLGPSAANAAVVEAMAPLILGRDPLEIEPIWLELYSQFRDQGQRGLAVTAISGIDIALWDIAGKHFGVPAHVLLGGAFRKAIPAYATGGFRPVGRDRRAALEEETAGYIAEGFKAVKIKIGFGLEEDVEVIAAVRAAIGPQARLLIDRKSTRLNSSH